MIRDEEDRLSFEDELYPELSEAEKKALDKFAKWIVSSHLTTPAIITFESLKPIGFLGSQFLLFFEPFIRIIPGTAPLSRIRSALGKREGMEYILQSIERLESEKDEFKQQRIE